MFRSKDCFLESITDEQEKKKESEKVGMKLFLLKQNKWNKERERNKIEKKFHIKY